MVFSVEKEVFLKTKKMKLSLANKFLVIGILLYLIAGVAAITQMNYSIIILLAAIIFFALGLFASIKSRAYNLFKKKT